MVLTRSRRAKAARVTVALKSPISEPNSPSSPVPASRKRPSPEPQDLRPAKKTKTSEKTTSKRKPLLSTPPKDSIWRADDDTPDTSEEDQSTIKSFGQDTFMHEWEALESQNMLEFYLAYPHNRNATLCEYHFLQLSERWYERRKAGVEEDLKKMFKTSFGSKYTPDFSSLGLPVDQDTWDLMPLEEFMGDLSRQIAEARDRLEKEQGRITFATGHTPMCEVGPRDEHLRCALCPDDEEPIPPEHMSVVPEAFDTAIAIRVQEIRERWEKDALTCGHTSPIMILNNKDPNLLRCEECGHTQPADSDARPAKYTLQIAGTLFPVEVCPSQMAINSRVGHGDVGGVHFIVDICSNKTMIKFR
ncbi:hypothetical protein ACHAPT_007202 [Fusarium lateritium]